MRKLVLYCVIAISIIILNGCTPSIMVLREDCPDIRLIKPEPGKATLVIARMTPFGAFLNVNNYLDQLFIGSTSGFGYFYTNVSPGEHYLITKSDNYEVDKIKLEPNNVYYFNNEVRLTNSFSNTNSGKIKPVDKNIIYEELSSNKCYEIDRNSKIDPIDNDKFRELTMFYEKWSSIDNDEKYKRLIEHNMVRINNVENFTFKKTITDEKIYIYNKLSAKYDSIVVKNFKLPENVYSDFNDEERKELLSNSDDYIKSIKLNIVRYLSKNKLFKNIEPTIIDTKKTLVLDGSFTKFNIGSNVTKFLLGFSFGDSAHYVKVSGRLFDAETGEVLAIFTDRETGILGTTNYIMNNDIIFSYQVLALGDNIGAFVEKLY